MKAKILKFTTSSTNGVFYLNLIASLFFVYALFMFFPSTLWFLSFFIYFLTGCLGITITFHRYLSHRSFEMSGLFEKAFSIFGSLGGTGSPLGWVALHRAHHKYSDEGNDPHSPANGKLKILLSQYNFQLDKWTTRELIASPFHRSLHIYYHALLLLWSLLWLLIGFKWFLFVVAVPICIQNWVSAASNIFNHWLGYRNFDTAEKSTNNFFIALISWGEGWHNNHHKFPSRWTFGIKWWEFDISSWIIRLVKT